MSILIFLGKAVGVAIVILASLYTGGHCIRSTVEEFKNGRYFTFGAGIMAAISVAAAMVYSLVRIWGWRLVP